MSAFDFLLSPFESAFAPVVDLAKEIFAPGPQGGGTGPKPVPGKGGGTPADLADALGHYTENTRSPGDAREREWEQRKFMTDNPNADEHDVAAYAVGQHYEGAGQPLPDQVPLGNLDTPEGRLKALSKVTQQSTKDASGEEHCGAASIVGGALLSGGTTGLTTLMNAMEARTDDAGRSMLNTELKKVRDDIKNHKPITVEDMHKLQSTLYDVMKTDIAHEDQTDNAKVGLKPDVLQNFIHGDEKLQKLFADNHMDVEGINNTGEGDNNHAVLKITDAQGKFIGVYDPYKRVEGQMVTDPDELEDYRQADQGK